MTETITLEEARDVIEAAEEAAEEMGLAMVVTVANPAGNLVAQHRMDGAWLASVSISRNKAYTAAALQMPTHELADPTQPGESLWGLQTTDENRLVVFGGGYPLEVDGDIVGTVGVSGGEVPQDMAVAEAAVDAFQDTME
ncbi:heme-binding protein (plasmid) [Halarchaeum sp. CBA1220]|uniref:GlcG/HbpS family heme-binding protein n=1 Tax=Halarchaeum sp. CBA1220 TaxID=1853682 RepID=UPI000F3A8EA5|nr:heme-binding protein [Halarchaeum sp. CBA1220]QLC35366.1 heme-binding protein [Halarchaeum sp. CBA1220]